MRPCPLLEPHKSRPTNPLHAICHSNKHSQLKGFQSRESTWGRLLIQVVSALPLLSEYWYLIPLPATSLDERKNLFLSTSNLEPSENSSPRGRSSSPSPSLHSFRSGITEV